MEDEYTEITSEMDQDQEHGSSQETPLNEGENGCEVPSTPHTYITPNTEHIVNALTDQLQSMIEEKLSSCRSVEDKHIQMATSAMDDTKELKLNENESVELEILFENTHLESSSNITFTGASNWQDSGFQDFKDYLNYHCHIRNSEIPYTHSLVNSSGNYDYYTISQLETWVRKLYAENKISSYDEEQLFKFLNQMK